MISSRRARLYLILAILVVLVVTMMPSAVSSRNKLGKVNWAAFHSLKTVMTCMVEGCDLPPAKVRGALINLVGNIVLFLPFGLLSSVAMAQRKRATWARILLVFGAGLAFSATVEMVQFWLPTRSTSLNDVVLNGSGALLGATFAAVRPHHRSKSPAAAPGNAPIPAVSL